MQGDPTFEQLVARALKRHAEIQAGSGPDLLVLTPKSTSEPVPLFLARHGNNSTAEREADHWRGLVDDGWLVALPRSSQIGYRLGAYIWNDQTIAERELRAQHRALATSHRLQGSRSLIGGFSMGGRIAIRIALAQIVPVRGFIAVSVWLPPLEEFEPHMDVARSHGVRGHLIAGGEDTGAVDGASQLRDALQQRGIPCELSVMQGVVHDYPADFSAELSRALTFLL